MVFAACTVDRVRWAEQPLPGESGSEFGQVVKERMERPGTKWLWEMKVVVGNFVQKVGVCG